MDARRLQHYLGHGARWTCSLRCLVQRRLASPHILLWETLAKSSFDHSARKSSILLVRWPTHAYWSHHSDPLSRFVGGLAADRKRSRVSMKSADMSHMSSTDRMDDCCPHKNLPSRTAIDDCCSSMACPMNCLSFAGASSLIAPPPLPGSVMMSLVNDPVRSQEGSPPFRPPRI
jgi:hypothetical protein